MEKFESKPQLSRVEEALKLITSAADRIEGEFNRTSNSWLECFGSSIFAIETYLDCDQVKAEIGFEKFQIVIDRIESLKNKQHSLIQEYPDKESTVPKELKQELLNDVNVLK